MERDKNRLNARRAFVAESLNNSGKTVSETVSDLAGKLFLSESTIWKDVTIYCKDGINMPEHSDL
jgi:hypothetical protein